MIAVRPQIPDLFQKLGILLLHRYFNSSVAATTSPVKAMPVDNLAQHYKSNLCAVTQSAHPKDFHPLKVLMFSSWFANDYVCGLRL